MKTRTPGAARLRTTLLCSTLLWPLATPVLSYAASATPSEYNLARGDLGQVLNGFAAQAGVVLSFDPLLTQGKTSAGLHGRYSVEQALQALLQGNGLVALREDDGRYTLAPQPEAGAALNLGVTEVTSNQLGTITKPGRFAVLASS